MGNILERRATGKRVKVVKMVGYVAVFENIVLTCHVFDYKFDSKTCDVITCLVFRFHFLLAGLLSSGILKKGMARISFNKTEFLEFENGYMGLPYQPIIMIGFPNRQYFILRLRVDFEWKVDEKKNVTTDSTTLSHTLISFPRGDQLYFNTSSKRPSRAGKNIRLCVRERVREREKEHDC